MPRPRRTAAVFVLGLVSLAGCSSEVVWKDPAVAAGGYVPGEVAAIPPPAAPFYQNPALIPCGDHEFVWETIADVVDDYFKIEEEQPIRLVGQVATEGRLTTFPEVGSTILEPWRHDSVTRSDRIESTLQSIRRQAEVRVVPEQNGYLVEVIVYKELEDVRNSGGRSDGEATFRYDSSLTRVVDSLGERDPNQGWIDKGRDPNLEQRILSEIVARTGAAPIR
ncbi:MAG: hypothetical protein ACYC6Y_17140 [Thermoguttaceae bacterium]